MAAAGFTQTPHVLTEDQTSESLQEAIDAVNAGDVLVLAGVSSFAVPIGELDAAGLLILPSMPLALPPGVDVAPFFVQAYNLSMGGPSAGGTPTVTVGDATTVTLLEDTL